MKLPLLKLVAVAAVAFSLPACNRNSFPNPPTPAPPPPVNAAPAPPQLPPPACTPISPQPHPPPPPAPPVTAPPAAPQPPRPAPIPPATELPLNSVDSVMVSRPQDQPMAIVIHVSGTAVSAGWTNAKLAE